MAKTFRAYEPDQLYLLPPSPRDWLPEDHLVFFISDVADTLDLSGILGTYSEERGYPPYHPLLMVKILLYGYARGIYSSRKLARACEEDVAFRVLCGKNRPDFRTIADFRKRHLKAFEALFLQVLRLCQRAGMVKLGHVAIDGTKVKANASKHKAMSYARMQEEERRLKQEIAKLMREVRGHGPHGGPQLRPPTSEATNSPTSWRIARAASGRSRKPKRRSKPKPERPPPRPVSRRRDRGGPTRSQGAAELHRSGESHHALQRQGVRAGLQRPGGGRSRQPGDRGSGGGAGSNDKGQLVPMVEQVCENLDETPEIFSADAGYWTEADLETLEHYEIEAIVAPDKIRHRQWREQQLITGPPPEGLSRKERMRHLLKTERGRAEYGKRMSTAEPVFGQTKHARGFRQFLLRGHQKVSSEWNLVCTGHNLLKLFTFTRAQRLAGTPA
jgi:transposase